MSLVNGYCIGAGSAFLWGADYQLVNRSSVFQMPETLLGLFPDALATYHMVRLPVGYSYGLYLGLLGRQLKGTQMLHTGLATHFTG